MRKESRFRPNQPGTLYVKGLRPGPILNVSILDVSGSGIRVRASLPVPCGTIVEVQANHVVSVGRVCRCEERDGSVAYEIGIQVSVTYVPEVERPAACGHRDFSNMFAPLQN